ncbi:unnamed protein product [Periconia digitata]|uniref:Uncharacterized protein n=1 Tax=Periconia digitata TaxID=1303443 RepID=A0A9W4XDD1_9PLEO|nr:unnamed protein product [Periconia digitata]
MLDSLQESTNTISTVTRKPFAPSIPPLASPSVLLSARKQHLNTSVSTPRFFAFDMYFYIFKREQPSFA